MGTIIAIVTLIIGLIIVLLKAIGSGVKTGYDYTTKHVSPPVTWVKEKAIEAKEATTNSNPVTTIKNKGEKAEQAARLFIDAVRALKD
jgi:hypothetical protein